MILPGKHTQKFIDQTVIAGSGKDGDADAWIHKSSHYHLVKALSHLVAHIKDKVDPRSATGENHLIKCISRLSMALYIEQPVYRKDFVK